MVDFDALVLAPAMGAFGRPATFVPAEGAPTEVTGVFDAAHKMVEVDMGRNSGTVGVSSTAPAFGVRLAAFPQPPTQGDTLVIDVDGAEKTFVIVDIHPDGQGGAHLILHREG